MITTASALNVPLAHLHRWLDRMNVPPAPEDAGDGLWYRLGWLERAAASPSEGNEEELLGKVVQHLNEACGGVELQEGNAIEQFGELLGVVQGFAVAAGGPPPPASSVAGPAKGPVDALLDWKAAAWHPASEHPAEGAEVEAELAQGTHRGVAQRVRGPDGIEHLAVVSAGDQAVFWPAVRRWRFAG